MIYIRRSQNEQVHYTLLRSLYHKAKNDAKNSGVIFADCVFVRLSPFFYILV